LAAGAAIGASQPALALDYDRNDVRGRELGIVTLIAPVADNPVGVALRGTARRHMRRLYVGLEAQLGATLLPGPWLLLAGAVGAETADDAWQPLRGYAEAGVGALYAHTQVFDVLVFHGEAGVRYQLQSFERPHVLVHLGLRGMYNFTTIGAQVVTGIGWTFD
jgi:hypothetical protein